MIGPPEATGSCFVAYWLKVAGEQVVSLCVHFLCLVSARGGCKWLLQEVLIRLCC